MTALQEAIRMISLPETTPADPKARQGKIDELLQEFAFLDKRRKNLLGVERLAGPRFEERLAAIKAELLTLLPMLSLEPLRWRRDDGWPKLAILSIDSPIAGFETTWSWDDRDSDLDRRCERFVREGGAHKLSRRGSGNSNWVAMQPHVPEKIRELYCDVIRELNGRTQSSVKKWNQEHQGKRGYQSIEREGWRIVTRFGGLIPRLTRRRLEIALGIFTWQEKEENYPYREQTYPSVYLVFEPDEWYEESLATGDPIAVIWDGAQLRVLDVFDPTPLEKLVLEEHSA